MFLPKCFAYFLIHLAMFSAVDGVRCAYCWGTDSGCMSGNTVHTIDCDGANSACITAVTNPIGNTDAGRVIHALRNCDTGIQSSLLCNRHGDIEDCYKACDTNMCNTGPIDLSTFPLSG